jgi:hypothetical protein
MLCDRQSLPPLDGNVKCQWLWSWAILDISEVDDVEQLCQEIHQNSGIKMFQARE